MGVFTTFEISQVKKIREISVRLNFFPRHDASAEIDCIHTIFEVGALYYIYIAYVL